LAPNSCFSLEINKDMVIVRMGLTEDSTFNFDEFINEIINSLN